MGKIKAGVTKVTIKKHWYSFKSKDRKVTGLVPAKNKTDEASFDRRNPAGSPYFLGLEQCFCGFA